ncbi:MAG TPA: YerC/YecD family TrpR-related protein [Methanocorpusculum sp.]|nr:YerC/YecD family TrpR-related protein [Methanocorpusculum sp.]
MLPVPDHQLDILLKALVSLRTPEEYQAFLEDVCTIKEVQDVAQRLEVAQLLKSGKSYLEISKETGASTATISRVNRCLTYGSGGYRTVLDRMDEDYSAKH